MWTISWIKLWNWEIMWGLKLHDASLGIVSGLCWWNLEVVLCVDIINFLVKIGLRMGNGYDKEKVEWWMDYINKENKDSNMSLDGLCRGLGFWHR